MLDLGLRRVDLRLRGLERSALRVSNAARATTPWLDQGALAVVVVARLGQLAARRGQARARRAQRVLLVLRIEPRDHLARRRRVSPTLTRRSIMRPSMRKARSTSSSAWTVPVSDTVSPAACCSTVTTRTGRISGAAGSAAGWQATRSAGSAVANRHINGVGWAARVDAGGAGTGRSSVGSMLWCGFGRTAWLARRCVGRSS